VKVMVQVHLTNGELTVWWLNQDTPVAKLKGSWRGPIPPSTGEFDEAPGSSRATEDVRATEGIRSCLDRAAAV